MSDCRACLALLTLCVLAAACTTRGVQVQSEPPTLHLESLALSDARAHLALLVHNPNDHPVRLRGAALSLRVDGAELLSDDWPLDLEVSPRGNERLRLETGARTQTSRRLLERGGARDANIGYTLSAELRVDGLDNVAGELSDYLHPVPGQPGQFR